MTTHAAQMLAPLSRALDVASGRRPGHAARSCVIGMRLAQEIALPARLRPDLYYALLLKDLGMKDGFSGGAIARTRRESARMRGERGAALARQMGFSGETATAIRNLDEHWRSQPFPMLASIMSLAQAVELGCAHSGRRNALRVAEQGRGRWFDPDLVAAAQSLAQRHSLLVGLEASGQRVADLEPLPPIARPGGNIM